MKTTILILSVFLVVYWGLTVKTIIENEQKNPIKLIKKGCCQFRVNEYTHEVTHFEGCDNLNHVE